MNRFLLWTFTTRGLGYVQDTFLQSDGDLDKSLVQSARGKASNKPQKLLISVNKRHDFHKPLQLQGAHKKLCL